MTKDPITIRWIARFTYSPINPLLFVDHFEMNDTWPYLEVVVGNKVISLGYMDRKPQIEPHEAPVLLFSQYRLFKLTADRGQVIVSTRDPASVAIPGLSFTQLTFEPYTSLVQFDFEFHTMLILLDLSEEGLIMESHTPALTRATILYQTLKIEVVEGTFSFTSERDHPLFHRIVAHLERRYHDEAPELRALLDRLDPPHVPAGCTHLAMDYEVWYRGSRENQRLWPTIAREPPTDPALRERSILFHGCWYIPPEGQGYVGLSLRHDDNPHRYIPRLYLKPPLPSQFTLPVGVRDYCKRHGSVIKPPIPLLKTPAPVQTSPSLPPVQTSPSLPPVQTSPPPHLLLDRRGQVIACDEHPKVIVYAHHVVAHLTPSPDPPLFVSCEAQLLDRHFQRSRILVQGQWIESPGVRLQGVITLPWYYRQLVHDYHQLGRLRSGPLMDLSHLGIVDPQGKDIITFPVEDLEELYQAPSLETHRLCTFRYKYGVYETFRLLQRHEERSN